MQNTLYSALGDLGAGLAEGALNFHKTRVGEREQLMKESLAAFTAGDIQGAYHLARKADGVQGIAGALTDRQGPKLIGTTIEETVEAPRGLAGLAEVVRPRPDFQGPMPLAPAEAQGPMPGVTRKRYDPNRPDFANADNREAIRRYLGAPVPSVEYGQLNPFEITYDKKTGKTVRPADPKPVPVPTTRYMPDPVTGEVKPVTPGTTFGVKAPPAPQPRYMPDPLTGEVKPVLPGTKFGVKPPSAAERAMERKVAAAQLIAQDLATKFPWAGVQGVDPSTGDIILTGVRGVDDKTGMPAGAAGPVTDRGLRMLRDYMPGTTMLADGRMAVLGSPDLPSLRKRLQPATAKTPTLVANVDGVLVKKEEGVQVKTPATAKPFDETKADKIARNRLGIKPGRMILPSKREGYDREMAKLRAAHERASSGGKTLLQTLMEEP